MAKYGEASLLESDANQSTELLGTTQPSESRRRFILFFLWVLICLTVIISCLLCIFGLYAIYRHDTDGHFVYVYIMYHLVLLLVTIDWCISYVNESIVTNVLRYGCRCITGIFIFSAFIGKVLMIVKVGWTWEIGVYFFLTISTILVVVGFAVYMNRSRFLTKWRELHNYLSGGENY